MFYFITSTSFRVVIRRRPVFIVVGAMEIYDDDDDDTLFTHSNYASLLLNESFSSKMQTEVHF